MNKIDLINALKNECKISKKEAATIVDLFFDKISTALADGERVEIRGLCSFFVKEYKSYQGRNPLTGESTFKSTPKKLPFFKIVERELKRTGGLLIKGFFNSLYFYASKNYQRHIRTCRSRYIYLEIYKKPNCADRELCWRLPAA